MSYVLPRLAASTLVEAGHVYVIEAEWTHRDHRAPTPLTAAEIIAHPDFPNVLWKLTPAQKGRLAVAKGRGGPFDISYEVHGHGPIHMVWIMGLGSFKTSWQRQSKDFGHDRGSKFSCLIWDNRGMGESDKPLLRYSTSEMAKDAIEIFDHLCWTGKRELHVIGPSMGGMIAQELGLLIPERIASLTLLSTAARIVNTEGFIENLRNRINLFIPKPVDQQLAVAKRNLFSQEWLEAADVEGAWPTNGDRFAAQEITKRRNTTGFTRKGFILQAIAAGWHHKSPDQLMTLADKVGRDRIQVMHGGRDRMVSAPHGDVLVRELGGGGQSQDQDQDQDQGRGQDQIRYVRFENCGHVLPWEKREEFTRLLEDFIDDVEELNRKEAVAGSASARASAPATAETVGETAGQTAGQNSAL